MKILKTFGEHASTAEACPQIELWVEQAAEQGA